MAHPSFKHKLQEFLAYPILKFLFFVIWKSCRIKTVLGQEYTDQVLTSGKPIIPCYWHQNQVFGVYYMLQLRKRGLNLGVLISPSRHGNVPAKIVKSWGLEPIRGSSNRTGARALRDLYQLVTKQGISPINTSDGPTGPLHKFKPGAIMLAQMTQAPILPISYAASNFWALKTWDHFVIPKPFSRIVIAVGPPRHIEKGLSLEQMAPIQEEMEHTLASLHRQARDNL